MIETNNLNFRDSSKVQEEIAKIVYPVGEWESPFCSYCNSDFRFHKQIYYNVKNTYHSLVECQLCKLRFYSPRIKFSSLVKVGFGSYEAARVEANHCYEHGSFFDIKNKKEQKAMVRNYYKGNIISKFPKIPISVFEVGGGIGWFSSILKQDYGVEIIDGCEINKWSVQIANEKFGLNYISGEFNKYTPHRTYECGLMLDYIEHSYNPFQDLQKMSSMIEKGGTLFIKTFLEELDIERTMEAPVGHAYHFYGDVLKKMIIDVGFDICYWQEEGVQIIIIGKKR